MKNTGVILRCMQDVENVAIFPGKLSLQNPPALDMLIPSPPACPISQHIRFPPFKMALNLAVPPHAHPSLLPSADPYQLTPWVAWETPGFLCPPVYGYQLNFLPPSPIPSLTPFLPLFLISLIFENAIIPLLLVQKLN